MNKKIYNQKLHIKHNLNLLNKNYVSLLLQNHYQIKKPKKNQFILDLIIILLINKIQIIIIMYF